MEDRGIGKANQKLAYLMAFVAVVLWSSAFPGSRYSLEHFSPASLMLLRFIYASVVLVVISAARGVRLPEKRDLPMFVAGGLVGVFLYMLLFNIGAVTVVSGVASFIIASAPVFTIIMARVLLKEIVKPICWIGVAVSFGGLVVVMLSQTAELALGSGAIFILGSALASGAHSVIQRSLLKRYTALEATTYSVLAGTAFMLPFVPGAIRELPAAPMHVNLIVAFLGIFPAALGYLSWGFALAKAEKTTHVTVFLYLKPFMASLLGFLWLNETFSLWTMLGGVIIIAGMALTNYPGKQRT